MDETILLIKRLLFAYSSIFLVLTFAIIQSDHGRYDRALASIDEIHKLTAAIDGNFLSRLTAPNAAIRKVERRHLSAFKSNISFEYNSQHIDYALTPKPLMGDVNGFAFARSSVEEFPDEFLKYDRVSEFVPPLRKVSSLRDYMPLHDALLVDARYEALVPELTKPIRMELYRQSSRSFNVIDQVTVEHADSYKILDAIDLVSPVKGADEKTCRLTPIRTQINDQHGFVCHVSGVVSDGQQYSARLFVQAESTIELLTHDAMLEIIKIPTSRQVDFDVAHRELAQLAGPYPGLAFEDLYKVLETEKNRTPTTVSILGAQVNIDLLLQVAFGGGAGFFLYVLLHLRELQRRMKSSVDPVHSTWSALYPGGENLLLTLLQLFVLPGGLLVIVLSKYQSTALNLIVASFSAQMISGILVFRAILIIRRSLHAQPSDERGT